MKNAFIIVLVLLVLILGNALLQDQPQIESTSIDAAVVQNDELKISELKKMPLVDLEALSKTGDSHSQIALADVHYSGLGVAKDLPVARDYYRQAALQGSEIAVARLAKNYGLNSDGEVIAQDKLLSTGVMPAPPVRKTLENTTPLPKSSVDRLYEDGIDLVGQNNENAFAYLMRAAENGHAEAQFYVGIAFLRGFGTRADKEKGELWLNHAAKKGDANAKYKLGMMYENGVKLTRDSTKAQYWKKQAKVEGYQPVRSPAKAASESAVLNRSTDSPTSSEQKREDSKQATTAVIGVTLSAQKGRKTIERTQFYLSVLGLYDGPKDGVMNESLEHAIYRFQVDHRISADGRVSETLLSRIKENI